MVRRAGGADQVDPCAAAAVSDMVADPPPLWTGVDLCAAAAVSDVVADPRSSRTDSRGWSDGGAVAVVRRRYTVLVDGCAGGGGGRCRWLLTATAAMAVVVRAERWGDTCSSHTTLPAVSVASSLGGYSGGQIKAGALGPNPVTLGLEEAPTLVVVGFVVRIG